MSTRSSLLREFKTITVAFAARKFDQCISGCEDLKRLLDEYLCDEDDTDAGRAAVAEICDGLAGMAGADGTPFSVRFAALEVLGNTAAYNSAVFSEALKAQLVPLCLRCLACLPSTPDGMEWPIDDCGDMVDAMSLLEQFIMSFGDEPITTVLNAAVATAVATWDTSMVWSDKVAILLGTRGLPSLNGESLQKLHALGVRDEHPQVRATGLDAAADYFRYTRPYPDERVRVAARDNVVRQHIDLLVSMMAPGTALDAPRTLLLRCALSSANESFETLLDGDDEAAKRNHAEKFQPTELVRLLTSVAVADGRFGKAAAVTALRLTRTVVSNTGVGCPALVGVVCGALKNVTGSANALPDDEHSVVKAALHCVSLLASLLETEMVVPFAASFGEFFCRAIDAIAMGDSFVASLLGEWISRDCGYVDKGVLAAWVPLISGKLVSRTSLTGIAATQRDSDAMIKCKAVCLLTMLEILKILPPSVLGRDVVGQFAIAACDNVDYITAPKAKTSEGMSDVGADATDGDCTNICIHAQDIIERVLILERRGGATTTQYIPPTVVERLSQALAILFVGTDVLRRDLTDNAYPILPTVTASFNGVVPVESAKAVSRNLMTLMQTVAAALLAHAGKEENSGSDEEDDDSGEDDEDEDDHNARGLHIARTLGFLHRATAPNDCPELHALMEQAYALFGKLFKTVPALTLALQTAFVAHARPGDVVSKKAELVRSATTAVQRSISGEEDAAEHALQLSTELLDFTARANGQLSLDRKFVKSVVQACQGVLDSTNSDEDEEEEEDEDEDETAPYSDDGRAHQTNTAVRAAIAAAEWLQRNNAPEAAGAAVALCAKHLKIKARPHVIVEVLQATAIMDRLAHWAADPELSAVYYVFPLSRDAVIEAIEDSKFLSPAAAAALQEARSIEVPETVLPVRKRQR